jgi:hypothetical protein
LNEAANFGDERGEVIRLGFGNSVSFRSGFPFHGIGILVLLF